MKPARKHVIAAACGAVLVLGLIAPTVTRQGIDYHVSRHSIPLYVKAIDFLHRHNQYQALADEITHGLRTDQDRVMAVYRWTREHIRPTPAGWPIVDDHVLNIIIRGYGLGDQSADVFTTLSTYAGVPAFWRALRIPEGTRWLILSFARVDGRWVMLDVGEGLLFTDANGRWLNASEAIEHPETLSGFKTKSGVFNQRYLDPLRPFRVPKTLRPQKQMPWLRLIYELRRALRLESEGQNEPEVRTGGMLEP